MELTFLVFVGGVDVAHRKRRGNILSALGYKRVNERHQLETRVQQKLKVLHLFFEQDLIVRRKLVHFFLADVERILLRFFYVGLEFENLFLDERGVFLDDFVGLEDVVVLDLYFVLLVDAVIDLVFHKLASI